MKPKTWFGAAAVVLTLGLALAWAFAPRPVEVELAPVTQGRFETTIDDDGKTRLAERYVVSAPLAGRLARITLRELGARVESAQDNVQRTATRIARAQVSLEQAKNDARRSEQLAQQGFIARTKLDSDRLNTQAAEREVEAAGAERRIAGHDLEQARAALGAVRPQAPALGAVRPQTPALGALRPSAGAGTQRGFAVRAPVAGRVLRVLQVSEGIVALGTPLLELGDTRRLEIVAELLTTDALAAQPGSRVMIERWGGPKTLEGRVRSVEPGAFTKVSALGVEEQRVRVLIDISSPLPEWQALGDGYRVSVRIVTLSQDQAVQVPVSAVFPLPGAAAGAAGADTNGGSAPSFAVFVNEAGRAKQVPVALAARNGSAAWIKSGLTMGQQVIVYPPATVRDGVRVAARKV